MGNVVAYLRHCASSYGVKPRYKKRLYARRYRVKPQYRKVLCQKLQSQTTKQKGTVPEVTQSNHNTERHCARSYRVKPQNRKALCQKLQSQTTI